jgi:hypothetical protein
VEQSCCRYDKKLPHLTSDSHRHYHARKQDMVCVLKIFAFSCRAKDFCMQGSCKELRALGGLIQGGMQSPSRAIGQGNQAVGYQGLQGSKGPYLYRLAGAFAA